MKESKMPKRKTSTVSSSIFNKSNNITVRPMKPFCSESVKKWRGSKRNASYFDAFDEVILILNRDENRILEPPGDGYDYRLKACHQHFTKKIAIFYRYVNTQLCVLAVMKHVNDSNLWKPL
jgi:hypothetical protein